PPSPPAPPAPGRARRPRRRRRHRTRTTGSTTGSARRDGARPRRASPNAHTTSRSRRSRSPARPRAPRPPAAPTRVRPEPARTHRAPDAPAADRPHRAPRSTPPGRRTRAARGWAATTPHGQKVISTMVALMFVSMVTAAAAAVPNLPDLLRGLVPRIPDGSVVYVLSVAGGVG